MSASSSRKARPSGTPAGFGRLGAVIAGSYRRFLRRAGRTSFFMRHVIPITTRIDRFLYPRTGGRLTTTWPANIPTALLTTTGRHSGQPRVFPLFYQRDGLRVYVVTSIRGDWYRNLLANPVASLQLGRRTYRCRGQLLSEAEREALWPRFAEMWPAYDDYRRRTGALHLFALDLDAGAGPDPATPNLDAGAGADPATDQPPVPPQA